MELGETFKQNALLKIIKSFNYIGFAFVANK